MADNKDIDGRDSNRVAGDESYEPAYLEEKPRVTREQVRQQLTLDVDNDGFFPYR